MTVAKSIIGRQMEQNEQIVRMDEQGRVVYSPEVQKQIDAAVLAATTHVWPDGVRTVTEEYFAEIESKINGSDCNPDVAVLCCEYIPALLNEIRRLWTEGNRKYEEHRQLANSMRKAVIVERDAARAEVERLKRENELLSRKLDDMARTAVARERIYETSLANIGK
jgi:hypothetical protein